MLNPQPLPPGASVSLNPQPLPPGAMVSLNPQPLPPGGMVSLNPQPFPPGASIMFNQPYPPDPCRFFSALKRIPVKAQDDFGKVKTDGNRIGNDDFGGSSNLLEEEGIFYYFQHEKGAHQLVRPGSVLAEVALGGACATAVGIHSIGGGGGEGKVHVHEITFTKPSGMVGPALVIAGKGVQIDFCKTDEGTLEPPGSLSNGAPSHRWMDMDQVEADPFDDAWQLTNEPKNGFYGEADSPCAWCP